MTADHPLLAILPTVQSACRKHDVPLPRVLRAAGQPYAIEVTSRSGRTFEIELHDDAPHHRAGDGWVKTNAESIEEDINDDWSLLGTRHQRSE